ncbi:MAG TPA: thiamine-phosphate kinase [Limnobacter sp.]|nr:thiamine-phosphate kinase [Limnobacter sp.]
MEFDLIRQYFEVPFASLAALHGQSLRKGIGDDCAHLCVPENHTLYVSSDSSVEAVHFFIDDAASNIAAKALISNLSDLAACGAQPLGFSLNLTLPPRCLEPSWLEAFSSGLLRIASTHDCPLIGGDTTRGPCLVVSITVYGHAPQAHHGFHRSLAEEGQDLWVSGVPGLARLGMLCAYRARNRLAELCLLPDEYHNARQLLDGVNETIRAAALAAFESPVPRLELGVALRPFAGACLDLSDGLSGDLSHISKQSGVALRLQSESLIASWQNVLADGGSVHEDHLLALTLAGGDDYELCFTAAPGHRVSIAQLSQDLSLPLHLIGSVHEGAGVFLHKSEGQVLPVYPTSYNHFDRTQDIAKPI